jgi:PAS domain S-box-containing protein
MNKTRILIVEDEFIVAADLAGKLMELGYEVAGTASEGKRAIELVEKHSPDLVLMDIKLEGEMDGIQTAEAIGKTHDIPVIYLTAHSDATTLARAKVTGPSGYILKPFEERELATQIELALYKHEADRKIRDQREWFRVTLTSLGDAVIAVDSGNNITFINPVAESLTGWRMEEVSGQPLSVVFDIIHENTGEKVESPVNKVIETGRIVALENHTALVTRDGRNIPIEDSAAPIMDAAGKIIGVVLVFHDVTEKRRAEDALRDLAHFPEENPNLIMRYTLQGYLLYANTPAKLWLESLGWNSGEPAPGELHSMVIKTREDKKTEIDITCKRGLTFNLIGVQPAGAEYINIYGTDITERKKATAALQNAYANMENRVKERTAELEWRNRELQEFAYVASHDLQEPLRKIKLFEEMIEKEVKGALTEQGKDYLLRMNQAADRMQRLVKALLSYARTTKQTSPFLRVSLKEIVESVVKDLLPEDKGLSPVIEIADLPEIDADTVQMQQLFQNLIVNALHYQEEASVPKVKISGRLLESKYCELIVEDNGIGFDMAYADKIFLPFERLHPRNKYEGTGMGLAICRKIVERHGGRIGVRSAPGEGATFIITLPMRQTNES